MRRAAPWLVAALGAALCAAGVVVTWAVERSLPDDLGWLPYTPRDGGLPDPGPPAAGGAYESELTLSFDRPWPAPGDVHQLVGPALVVAGLVLSCGPAGRGVAHGAVGRSGRRPRRWGPAGRRCPVGDGPATRGLTSGDDSVTAPSGPPRVR